MPAKSAASATRELKDAVQLALSCVTRAVAVTSPAGYRPAAVPHILSLGQGFAALSGGRASILRVRMGYRLEPSAERPPVWLARPASYEITLDAADGRELLAWHWHPQARGEIDEPHLHLGAGSGVNPDLAKGHLPTGPVLLPRVLRYAIRDLGVRPSRTDWEQALGQAEAGMAFA